MVLHKEQLKKERKQFRDKQRSYLRAAKVQNKNSTVICLKNRKVVEGAHVPFSCELKLGDRRVENWNTVRGKPKALSFSATGRMQQLTIKASLLLSNISISIGVWKLIILARKPVARSHRVEDLNLTRNGI